MNLEVQQEGHRNLAAAQKLPLGSGKRQHRQPKEQGENNAAAHAHGLAAGADCPAHELVERPARDDGELRRAVEGAWRVSSQDRTLQLPLHAGACLRAAAL